MAALEPYHPPSEWERMKPTIYGLYIERRLSKKETRDELEYIYNFSTSVRALKSRIEKWRFKREAADLRRSINGMRRTPSRRILPATQLNEAFDFSNLGEFPLQPDPFFSAEGIPLLPTGGTTVANPVDAIFLSQQSSSPQLSEALERSARARSGGVNDSHRAEQYNTFNVLIEDIDIENDNESALGAENSVRSPQRESLNKLARHWMLARHPLHRAAQHGHLALVLQLLHQEQEIDARDENGSTPLALAAEEGHLSVVGALLSANANPNLYSYETSRQPLHQAARSGHSEIVYQLLEVMDDIDRPDRDGASALFLAAEKGDTDIVSMLLRRGANANNVDFRGRLPLHQAAESGHIKTLRVLIPYTKDVDLAANNGTTALWLAAQQGDAIAVHVLLEKGAKPDTPEVQDKGQPLYTAIQNKHTDVALRLISKTSDIDAALKDGTTALWIAVHKDLTQLAVALMKRNAQLNIAEKRSKRRPIHEAASNGNLYLVQLFVGRCDINATDADNRTALLLAAKAGHKNIVSILLQNSADQTIRSNSTGTQALHEAAASGHVDIVHMLLKAQAADVNAVSGKDKTALAIAAKNFKPDVIKVLLDHQADPNLCTTTGKSPLHYAVQEKCSEIAQMLLDKEACPDLVSRKGVTPLWTAVRNSDSDATNMLLGHQADVNRRLGIQNLTLLHLAAAKGHRDIIDRILKEKNVDIDAKANRGYTPLMLAASEHISAVRTLLEKGANAMLTKSDERQALHQAAQAGHTEIVALLADNMPDIDCPDDRGATPLMLACANGFESIAALLLKKKANPNSFAHNDHRTILHFAVQGGNENIVKLLLDHNADVNPDVNATDNNNCSALILAAERGQFTIVHLLLDDGADPNIISSSHGRLAIHGAAQGPYPQIVRLLLKYESYYDHSDHHGVTPLFLAAQEADEATVSDLIQKQADCNAADARFGRRPLHQAAQSGHIKILQLLVQHGAEIDAQDSNGATALVIAAENGDSAAVRQLLELGADPFIPTRLSGARALHCAIRSKNSKAARVLMQKMLPRIDVPCHLGETPLYIAAATGNLGVVKELLRLGADPKAAFRPTRRFAIMEAIKNGHIDIAFEILHAMGDVDD